MSPDERLVRDNKSNQLGRADRTPGRWCPLTLALSPEGRRESEGDATAVIGWNQRRTFTECLIPTLSRIEKGPSISWFSQNSAEVTGKSRLKKDGAVAERSELLDKLLPCQGADAGGQGRNSRRSFAALVDEQHVDLVSGES